MVRRPRAAVLWYGQGSLVTGFGHKYSSYSAPIKPLCRALVQANTDVVATQPCPEQPLVDIRKLCLNEHPLWDMLQCLAVRSFGIVNPRFSEWIKPNAWGWLPGQYLAVNVPQQRAYICALMPHPS